MNSKNLSKSRVLRTAAHVNPCFTQARVIFFLGALFLWMSCSKPNENSGPDKSKSKVVAKIYDREVLESEIEEITSLAKRKEDSVRIVQLYLDKIALEKALLQRSIGSGLVDMTDIEAKTNEFRNSLINLRFEREYTKKNLDTTFIKTQLKDYFEKNRASFVLNHDIFLAYYIAMPANTPKIEKMKELMRSDKPNDFEELKNQCLRYANLFSLDNKHWLRVPLTFTHEASLLAKAIKTKQIVSIEKEDQLYLVRVFDYKFTNQPSPFLYVENDIQTIILNKRKMELLRKLNEQVLDEAKKSNKIEIY
jgi:hypothetical protein